MEQEIRYDDIAPVLKGFKLPARPDILFNLERAGMDLKKMEAAIEKDPALAASVLKVVNSPVIGLETKVSSISLAISLLGVKCVKNIIAAAFLQRSMCDYDNLEKMENYWESTIKVSTACATIARTVNSESFGVTVDEAYCAGLFHNIGMPMMLDKYANYFDSIKHTYKAGGLLESENELFNCDHTVLGHYLTKGWGLSEEIINTVSLHHNMDALLDVPNFKPSLGCMLCILKMAEQIAGEAEDFGEVDYNIEWAEISPLITSHLGLTFKDFFELEDLVIDTIKDQLNVL